MPEDISLLPKEIERKREIEARNRLLRKVSLAFLALAVFLGLFVSLYSLALGSQFTRLEEDIRGEKSKIGSLLEIELKAQDLNTRSKALQDIFAQRAYFSRLLETLARAVPGDVSLTEMTVPSEETVSLSGISRSYVSLAKFLLNLKEAGVGGEFFEQVELRSVSLDQQTGDINFNLDLKIAEGVLQ